MPHDSLPKPQAAERDPDMLARVGGWLFRHRTAIPLPIAAALLLVPARWFPASLSTSSVWPGVPVVLLGEAIRFWAVHHIGAISRTRTDRLGPLVDTGPFSLVRNPLYVGNILLWAGFAVSSRLLVLAPLIVAMLALEYHAIVRWEERLLTSRMGEPYESYTRRVPRWLPLARLPARAPDGRVFSWRDTFHSERGTLIAIAAGFALLAVKARLVS
jgi:protein-S-isoprenylcysteine O-methyltransferase Ste14